MIQIKALNLDRIDNSLRSLIREIDDFSELFNDLIDNLLFEDITDIFESDGEGTWDQRKDSKTHELLRLSFALLNSLTRRGGNNIANINNNSLEIGSDISYHDVHEFGAPSKNIPERPILGILIQNGIEDRIANNLDEWVQRRINRLNL